ncbi:hypothetical protein [Calothrix sp. NIES-2098]|uniref:hypothetical protein n=1 Tax=Calothrix sp. NIES-2098 TaxID=1954171 RepID=UPI000B5EF8B2|nr:hypothetical protein NIES2098_12540 [Calothrix sp. NIES-2098]
MTRIVISDLHHNSSNLIVNAESFIEDINETESMFIHGGDGYAFREFLNFGVKVLEYALIGFAIFSIVSLVQSFLAPRQNQANLFPSINPPIG